MIMGPNSVRGKASASGGAESWKRSLQRVSLRTKLVVPMLALAITPAMAIGIFTITSMRDSLRQSAVQRVIFETSSRAQEVQGFLRALQRDLLFLSQLQVVRELAAAEASGTSERVAVLRRNAEQEFLIFSQGKRAYYQVRYLDRMGREVVRLNLGGGLPFIVPSDELQDKSRRYYVREAMALDPGMIYVSRMDLNLEYGKVEVPHRGVLRFATPVLGYRGKGRGLLVINLLADSLFSLVGSLPPGAEAWWSDENGTYLGYVGESEEKRRLYNIGKRRRLSADYSPAQISAILHDEDSGQVMETAEALLHFAVVSFDAAVPERRLTLIISHPLAPIEAPIRNVTIFLSVVVGVVVAIAAVLGVLLAYYLARPVAILRQATRAIAAGDLSKHVEVTTGDEIEGFAADFNAMTERLREAQERLSGWNVELEREVARQTQELHQLQTRLARTDKLASIGQMTAGVMHEIGNPLAAMKTKIQVAEEDGDAGEGSRVLLSELLHEVDRLATFLRSFSRLARLGESRKQDVSPCEVVRDVTSLVTPELQRRGITLRVDTEPDMPTIRGDADQHRQLLINLILNAMEASPSGGEILVRVRRIDTSREAARSAGAVRIEVVDHGVGMPPEIIDKIWDPFFTTKTEGTGLGLAICRQIVHDHHGIIQVTSESGKGTVVCMTFPGVGADKVKMASGGLSAEAHLRQRQGQ